MNFNFQKIVIVIAIILLILALAFIATAISNEKKLEDFPPVIAECPDYWKRDVSYNDNSTEEIVNICKNIHGLGVGQNDIEQYIEINGSESMCDKKIIANNYNLVWDGISNNPKLDKCTDN